jgi:hypothetical protein
MKVTRDMTTFKPVTITFETHAELKKFVVDLNLQPDDKVIPFAVWSELHDIVYGSVKS